MIVVLHLMPSFACDIVFANTSPNVRRCRLNRRVDTASLFFNLASLSMVLPPQTTWSSLVESLGRRSDVEPLHQTLAQHHVSTFFKKLGFKGNRSRRDDAFCVGLEAVQTMLRECPATRGTQSSEFTFLQVMWLLWRFFAQQARRCVEASSCVPIDGDARHCYSILEAFVVEAGIDNHEFGATDDMKQGIKDIITIAVGCVVEMDLMDEILAKVSAVARKACGVERVRGSMCAHGVAPVACACAWRTV